MVKAWVGYLNLTVGLHWLFVIVTHTTRWPGKKRRAFKPSVVQPNLT